jgi:small subunit ribosomal protein S16
MLKIRLQRVGRVHEPTFRLVLTDSQNSTKSGRYVEVLGNHDPRRKSETKIDSERVLHWISKGAQPTPTVHNMLITLGFIKGKKVNVLPKKSAIKTDTPAEGAPAA